jgi:hypothetical protein
MSSSEPDDLPLSFVHSRSPPNADARAAQAADARPSASLLAPPVDFLLGTQGSDAGVADFFLGASPRGGSKRVKTEPL